MNKRLDRVDLGTRTYEMKMKMEDENEMGGGGKCKWKWKHLDCRKYDRRKRRGGGSRRRRRRRRKRKRIRRTARKGGEQEQEQKQEEEDDDDEDDILNTTHYEPFSVSSNAASKPSFSLLFFPSITQPPLLSKINSTTLRSRKQRLNRGFTSVVVYRDCNSIQFSSNRINSTNGPLTDQTRQALA